MTMPAPQKPANGRKRLNFDSANAMFLRFIALAAVAIVIIMTSGMIAKRTVLRQSVLENAKADAVRLAANFRLTVVPQLIHINEQGLQTVAYHDRDGLDHKAFDQRVRDLLLAAESVKIKVFSREGFIVYSTDESIIGKDNRKSKNMMAALSGVTTPLLKKKNEFQDLTYEKRFNIDLVETYVPIYGENDDIIGAFEMYNDVTEYFAEADRATGRLIGITLGVLLIVFTCLSLVMWRATRIIGRRTQELKQSQADLVIEAERAEAASQSKSAFVANMSHEIRTPMTAILGFTDMLLNPDLCAKDRVECVETIRRNGGHLLSIINDILDVSKIEAGKLETESRPCRLRGMMDDVLNLMRVRSEAKNIGLSCVIDADIPQWIFTDELRIRQIMVNLIGNAIKFTSDGEVAVHIACDGEHDGQQQIRFDVTDTGIGMTAEQTNRLFQPFTQADQSTTRKFGGTGLGLMISKRLTYLLGGDVTIRSEAGVGSTFTATIAIGTQAKLDELQIKQAALLDENNNAITKRSEHHTATAAPAQSQGTRILLAEDSPDNQRLIMFILKKAGHDVTLAENGQIACDKALQAEKDHEPFDVILMDMQMPVLDGYGATQALRQAGYERPIIALTANAMADDRQKCADVGCDDFATKPIVRDELFAAIKQCIAQYRASEHQDAA